MKQKNTFFNAQTLIQFALLIVAFIFVAMLSTGFELNWDKINIAFAILVAIRLAFTILTYNIVFTIDNVNRRQIKNTKYYVTIATNKKKISVIYKDKRFDELDKAIKEDNKERFIKACNYLIRSVSSRISYDDICIYNQETKKYTYPDIEEIGTKFKLSDKKKKQFQKVIRKVTDGDVKFEEIETDDILIDKDEKGDKAPTMKFNFKAFLLKQNLVKGFTFLVTSVVMTVMNFTGGMANFWVELSKNATLLLGGAVSAIMLSYAYVKNRTSVFEQKNNFLEKRMSIMEEYKEEKQNGTSI